MSEPNAKDTIQGGITIDAQMFTPEAALPGTAAEIVARLAQLEAELATARHQSAYCADETKQALADMAAERERSAALAVGLNLLQKCSATMAACGQCLQRAYDTQAILATHDAEVARKAKVEALEDLERNHANELMEVYGGRSLTRLLHVRIAALKAEGGKG